MSLILSQSLTSPLVELPYVPEKYLRTILHEDYGDSMMNVSKRFELLTSCIDGQRVKFELLPSTPQQDNGDGNVSGVAAGLGQNGPTFGVVFENTVAVMRYRTHSIFTNHIQSTFYPPSLSQSTHVHNINSGTTGLMPVDVIKGHLESLLDPTFLNSTFHSDLNKTLFSSPYHNIPSSNLYHPITKWSSPSISLMFGDQFHGIIDRFNTYSLYRALFSIFSHPITSTFSLKDQYTYMTRTQQQQQQQQRQQNGGNGRRTMSSFRMSLQERTNSFRPTPSFNNTATTPSNRQTGNSGQQQLTPNNGNVDNYPHVSTTLVSIKLSNTTASTSTQPQPQSPHEDPTSTIILDRREQEKVLVKELQNNSVFQANTPLLINTLTESLIGWTHALLLLDSNPNAD